ncbi:MAG: hypothetical protein L0Y72_13210 [Gemmataceae bacterium]|nr:hypothetical protein [Gemmataceae bacterium]
MNTFSTSLAAVILFNIAGQANLGQKDNGPPGIDAIVETWRKRQDRVKSFDFMFSGSCSHTVEGAELMKLPSVLRNSIQPVSYRKSLRFVVSGPKAYLEYNTMNWSFDKNEFLPGKTIIANNTTFEKTAFAPDVYSFPTFHIAKAKKENTAAISFFVVPMNLVFRPLGRFQADKVQLDGIQDFKGKSLLIVTHGEDVLWVDPIRGFVPIRYYQRRGNRTIRLVELDYQFDESNGWIPKSWKENGERMSYSAELQVEKYELNPSIPESAFDMNPEPGTLVSDYVDDTYYIMRANDKRMLRPGEFNGTNFEELLHGNETNYVILILLSSLAVSLIVVGWIKIRRRLLKGAIETK